MVFSNKSFKKYLLFWFIVILLVLALLFVYFSKKEIFLEKLDGNEVVYSINYETCEDTFDITCQNKINAFIEKNIKWKSYTPDKPLLIYNPYWTLLNGVNIYFKTQTPVTVSYKISVQNDTIPDFERDFNAQDAYSKEHKYQIVWLVPGLENKVFLYLKDESWITQEHQYTIFIPNVLTTGGIVLPKFGCDNLELSEWVFAMLRSGLEEYENTYLYDNNGVLRAILPARGSEGADKLVFSNDNLIYEMSTNTVVYINRLGQIVNEYSLGKYEKHHDFEYDPINHKLLFLVSDPDKNSMEDLVLSIDEKTGERKLVLDFASLLEEMRKPALTYTKSKTDRIHVNSIDLVNNKDIIVSARELSSILYIEDIYDAPKLKYILGDSHFYSWTQVEDLVYKKFSDFVLHAGQHAVTYKQSKDLWSWQYYISMFNNNYGLSPSRPDFVFNYTGVSHSMETGMKSMYYEYLVDENTKTFELVKSVDVPYSSIVSSVQEFGSNIIVNSWKSKVFLEMDADGEQKCSFPYKAKKFWYRVLKYDFKWFWWK